MVADVPGWLDFNSRLVECGYSILSAANIPVTDKRAGDVSVLAALLLIRTLSNAKGVMVLAEAGRVVEARVIARCCFENKIWIARLINEGESFARKMLEDELSIRRSRGQYFLEDPNARLGLGSEVTKELRVWLKEANTATPHRSNLSAKQVARGTAVSGAYIFFAQLSADSAHPSLTALNRYKVPQSVSGEGKFDIDCDPPTPGGEMEGTLALCGLAVSGVCVGANQIFGYTAFTNALRKLCDEHLVLAGVRSGDNDAKKETPAERG